MDYKKEIDQQKHMNKWLFEMLTSQLEAINRLSLIIAKVHPDQEKEVRGIVKKMYDDLKAIKDLVDAWGDN